MPDSGHWKMLATKNYHVQYGSRSILTLILFEATLDSKPSSDGFDCFRDCFDSGKGPTRKIRNLA